MKKTFSVLLPAVVAFVLPAVHSIAGEDTQLTPLGVDEIAMIAVIDHGVDLTLSTPYSTDTTDDETYLNYTSTVPPGTSRSITAVLADGHQAPAGTNLAIETQSVSGSGDVGEVGDSNDLDDQTAITIVNNIGSGYTGTGSNGARIRYTFGVSSVGDLAAADESITVLFTLTEAEP